MGKEYRAYTDESNQLWHQFTIGLLGIPLIGDTLMVRGVRWSITGRCWRDDGEMVLIVLASHCPISFGRELTKED